MYWRPSNDDRGRIEMGMGAVSEIGPIQIGEVGKDLCVLYVYMCGREHEYMWESKRE